MDYLKIYAQLFSCRESEVFDNMIKHLKPSNTTWDYFVDWSKIYSNLDKENRVNLLKSLNILAGQGNFDQKFRQLIKANPSIIRILPLLLASRETSFSIIDFDSYKRTVYDFSCINNVLTDEDIDKYLLFVKKTGLKELIESSNVTSIIDYIMGVEVGMDSNARKNRGTATFRHTETAA